MLLRLVFCGVCGDSPVFVVLVVLAWLNRWIQVNSVDVFGFFLVLL